MARFPIVETPQWVESRANRIADPVERLRFLREKMSGPSRPSKARHAVRLPWHTASMVACLVVMVTIVPLPTGTAETFAKERRLVVGGSEHEPDR